uniref:Solute carrier family 5 member 5 n=1 Tax=Equus caballus TaxID=9796 RepID=A0A9L0RFS4_HORSE
MSFLWHSVASNWSVLGSGVDSVLDILVLVLYLLLVLGVGLRALVSSGRGTVEDFFLTGRKLAWLPLGASLFAANMGSGRLMSLARKGATSGIAVGAFEWNAPLFLCVLGWIFSPIYIKAGVVTMPEYLRKRFGGYRIQFLHAILSLFLYIFGDILVEVCTGAMFMKLIWGFDVYLVTTVLLTITGIYTITGGFAAVVYTDTLHAVIIVLGSVLLMGFGKSVIKKMKKPANYHRHISDKRDSSPRRASGRSFRRRPRRHCYHRRRQLHAWYCPEGLPVGEDVEVKDSVVDDPDPV